MSELTDADHVLLERTELAATDSSGEKIGIVVAGMHRSGTSALVRVLSLLGFDLSTELYPARPDNPLGYWEPLQVVEAHEEFLGAIGSSFDDFSSLPEGALRGEAARSLEDRLVQILETEFAGSRQFVVKDPRLCRLVPIWIAALSRFSAAPRFVLPIRNPLEVAASLKLRNEYSSTKSLLLWLRHMLEAERHTRQFPRSIVSYEALLRDWQGTVDKIARDLAVAWPRTSHASQAEIEQFLSPRRRHHSFGLDELRARADVVDWVKATYEVLIAAAAGELLEEDALDTLRGELDRADSAFGPLLAELRLVRLTQEKALLEQGTKLAEASANVDSREHDLDVRSRALGEATTELERLAAELAEREDALAAATTEATTSRQQIEQLQADLALREHALEEARADLPRLTRQLSDGEQALAVARAEAEHLQVELTERERTLHEARTRVSGLTAELAEREEALAAATTEATTSRQQIEQLQADLALREHALEEARADLPRLTRQLSDGEQALAVARAEAEHLQAELTERERALTEARTGVSTLTAELAQREQALAAAATEATRSSQQIEQLQSDLALREQALAEARAHLPRLTTQLSDGEQALAVARAEAEHLQVELTERERTLHEARTRVSGLTAELAEREEALAAAATEATTSRQQIEQLQADLALREHALEEARADLPRLTAELAEREEQRAKAEAGIHALEERIKALAEESEDHRARAHRALNEIASLRVESTAGRERLATTRSALFELRRQRQQLSRELARRIEALSANELEAQRLRTEAEEIHAANAQLGARVSLLEAEKIELGAAVAALEDEANRTGEDAQRHAATADDLRATLAVREQAETSAKNELRATRAKLAATETTLTELQLRRFVRPRTRRLALSQLGSWLRSPHRGGWRLFREYMRLRRAGTFATDAYLAANNDVDASGLDPLMHYLEHGIHEGRSLAPAPTPALAEVGGAESTPQHEADEPQGGSAPTPPPAAPALDPPTLASKPVVVPAPDTGQSLLPPSQLPAADYSDFIVLLSRQRSGTNPLRSVLETHPDVFCFNEVFNLPDRDSDEPLLRESNFFTFLERYAKNDVRRTMPDYHERLFLDYLEYLRCLSEKRYSVIDVKYNTTHFLARPWQERGAPYLLELIVKHGLYVLNVTRQNYLRYVLSSEKAWHSNCYTVTEGDPEYADGTRFLDPDFALRELRNCREEDDRIQRELPAGDRVLTYDYTEIFPGDGSAISPEFLEQLAAWRGIENVFTGEPSYKKQSSLPLRETIENYEEIATALRDGPFEYCLEDEPAYRTAEATDVPPAPRGHISRASYSDAAREGWRRVIGTDPESFCDALSHSRPDWIRGSLSEADARFLFLQALATDAEEAVEIGTASGFSTAVLAYAFHFRAAAAQPSHDWQVQSYDISEHLYFDSHRRVGDAARELLPEPLLANVRFNAPATAVDVADRHAPESIPFLFLDADHSHPWPALDVLAVLEALEPGGVVLLHDVNLPHIHPEFPQWGANYVYEELDVEKLVPDVDIPNLAALVVPRDKALLRDQLLAIVHGHPWDTGVEKDQAERVVRGAERRSG